jgi:VCBS repeat-containing protein
MAMKDKVSVAKMTKKPYQQGVAAGTIASIQNDIAGKPAWITSGTWKLALTPSNSNSTTASHVSEARFTAQFTMVLFNGTGSHKHSISDFRLTNVADSGNVTTITGTVTMTMRDTPQKNIPITIKMMNHKTISISLDTQANAHLGNTPMYGVITRTNSSYHSMTHNQQMAMPT